MLFRLYTQRQSLRQKQQPPTLLQQPPTPYGGKAEMTRQQLRSTVIVGSSVSSLNFQREFRKAGSKEVNIMARNIYVAAFGTFAILLACAGRVESG